MNLRILLKTAAVVCLVLAPAITPPAFAADSQTSPGSAAGLPKAEINRLGERMYRNGVLPSGALMPAFIRGDVEVDSSAFSCSSCHMRAGLGSFEGGVITPPTTGEKLYKPYHRPPSLGDKPDQAGRYVYAKTVIERPAYTRESLANAMRFGIDPAGQAFNDVMPRYPLSDNDMSILISYLENLSSEFSPGVDRDGFHFATIIAGDVSPEERQALLGPLRSFITLKNQQFEMYGDFIKFGYTPTVDMKYAFRRASLDIWELSGPAGTWQGQLDAYHKARPAFAVLGGISNSDWRPIHDFCESRRLPCLFPITDFPVVSGPGWYTHYFSKGYAQEGEAVARYLNRSETLSAGTSILQIIQDSPAGRALADGFDSAWSEMGHPAVTTLTLTADRIRDLPAMAGLLKKHRPAVLLLWTDAGLLPDLPALTAQNSETKMIFVSSGYLGSRTTGIPENIRDRVFITYPNRLTPYTGPNDGGLAARIPVLASARDFGDRRIASRMAAMLSQVALRNLNLIYDNLFSDHLLDIMGMQMDLTVQDYERLSFGPGQRFASKGCYIIQLGPGTEPALIPRSEWVIH